FGDATVRDLNAVHAPATRGRDIRAVRGSRVRARSNKDKRKRARGKNKLGTRCSTRAPHMEAGKRAPDKRRPVRRHIRRSARLHSPWAAGLQRAAPSAPVTELRFF